MTASKSLPARPSLESLRKQAKKLARDIAAGNAGAIARTAAHSRSGGEKEWYPPQADQHPRSEAKSARSRPALRSASA
jgi:hypothetical protein